MTSDLDFDALDGDNIFRCSGSVFFNKLENHIHSPISEILRNILEVKDIDCISVLEKVDEKCVENIEQFLRLELNSDMIPDGKSMRDYLGKFHKSQQKFKFS